jgi:SAM-dependent methyltransferase
MDLCGSKGFASVDGTAENTTLKAHNVDYITVAQAFHWFDRIKFKVECNRILKPNGKIILVWNSRDQNSNMVKDSDDINRKYCTNFKGFSGGMRGAEGERDFDSFFTGEYEKKTFQNDLTFDLDGFIGRTLSASYALKEKDDKFLDYITELTACFNKHAVDGKMIMPNITKSYSGRV